MFVEQQANIAGNKVEEGRIIVLPAEHVTTVVSQLDKNTGGATRHEASRQTQQNKDAD